MVYTSCKFLIPAQYKYGLAASQTGWTNMLYGSNLYDMSLDTFGSFPSTTGSLYLSLVTPCALNQLCVYMYSRRNTGTGYIVPKRGSTALAIGSYNPEYNYSSHWSLDGTSTGFYRTSSAANLYSWALFNLTNSTTDDDYELDIQGGIYVGSQITNSIIWSETFSLPLWDSGAALGMSFSQPVPATAQANVFDSWKRAKSFQVETSRQLKWSGLTAIQFGVFESAMLAFGDSVNKPFVIARLTDAGSGSNYEAEFIEVCITSKPQYEKSASGLYTVTLDLVELNRAY